MKDLKYKLHNKYFKAKHQIKPWLLKCLTDYHTDIVIERSDNHKIIFKCKNGREKVVSKGKTRRQITCPFKIRANFSYKQQLWTLVVINDVHDHAMDDDDDHYDPVHEITQLHANLAEDLNPQLTPQLTEGQIPDTLPTPPTPIATNILELSLYDEDIIHTTVSKFDNFMKSQLNALNDPIKLDILKRIVDNVTKTYKSLDDKWYLSNLSTLNDSGNYSSIPLSPLLNDDSNNQLDITLPGINHTPKRSGFVFPNQLINPQLPPINAVSPNLQNLANGHTYDKKLFTSINLLLDKSFDKFDKY